MTNFKTSPILTIIALFVSQFNSSIKCPGPCTHHSHHPNLGTPAYYPIAANDTYTPRLKLSLFSTRETKKIVREYVIYDAAALAGDIGGMLGMTLGVSMIAVFDAVWDVGRKGRKALNISV